MTFFLGQRKYIITGLLHAYMAKGQVRFQVTAFFSRRLRDVCGDFANLEDLPTQYSKMLGQDLRACIHMDECACVVSASDVLW
jgi:non-ribosomal peptide synthetase component F